jgi:hypothetical protein
VLKDTRVETCLGTKALLLPGADELRLQSRSCLRSTGFTTGTLFWQCETQRPSILIRGNATADPRGNVT